MTEFLRGPGKDPDNDYRMPASLLYTPAEPLVQIATDDELDPAHVAAMAQYQNNVLGFGQETFAWGQEEHFFFARMQGLLPWQEDMLGRIDESRNKGERSCKIAISGGRGVGKTGLVAILALWHVAMFRHSHTVIAAVTGQQNTLTIWKEVQDWFTGWNLRANFRMLQTRVVHKDFPNWLAITQTWSPERSEGFVGKHATNVCYLIDECSGVDQTILRAMEFGLTDDHVLVLYVSNPTRPTGIFYECFHGEARQKEWKTTYIDANEVPQIVPRDHIENILDECGGDTSANAYRVHVLGRFPHAGDDQVIPDWVVIQAANDVDEYNHPKEKPESWAPIRIGADVASLGENLTVFVVRQANIILEVQRFAKLELAVVKQHLITLLDKYKYYTRDFVAYVDGDGLTIHMIQDLQREKYPVMAVRSGGPAVHRQSYGNLRADMWFATRTYLQKEMWLDKTAWYFPILRQQLTDIFYRTDDRNLIYIERKKDMTARGIKSPDFADAFVYACMNLVRQPARVIGVRY